MCFKIGDVVQLRSGGPIMVVSEANDAGVVECTWFDKSGEIKTHVFSQEVLARA